MGHLITSGQAAARTSASPAWARFGRDPRRFNSRDREPLHTLRHAFISAALDAGVPLRDVQEAAWHAGVCGWPRSRHRTIQETSSGPKLPAKGGGGLDRLITA